MRGALYDFQQTPFPTAPVVLVVAAYPPQPYKEGSRLASATVACVQPLSRPKQQNASLLSVKPRAHFRVF